MYNYCDYSCFIKKSWDKQCVNKATGLSNSNYKLPDAGSKPTAGSIRTIILGKKVRKISKGTFKNYKKIFTKKNCGKMVTIK